MIILKILSGIIIFIILTALTQVGGVIFLISLIIFILIDKRIQRKLTRLGVKILCFTILYLMATLLVVPPIAKQFGRVRLPLTETNHVQPLTIWTCLLNRNYVRSELLNITYDVGEKINLKFPGTIINYLDSGFPFKDGFPLPPHLSHNDGRKVDIAFLYRNADGSNTNYCPSPIGYGVCEGPANGEFDRPLLCAKKGFILYGALEKIISQKNKTKYPFDPTRTKALVNLFAAQKGIEKILIEPHLKDRLKLTSSKIRLHGCNAVRHDDHMHIQLSNSL